MTSPEFPDDTTFIIGRAGDEHGRSPLSAFKITGPVCTYRPQYEGRQR